MDNNERIERIGSYEAKLNRCRAAVDALSRALDEYESAWEDLDELEAYYVSSQWREDFEADEKGLLPKDLPRGVLSEDAVNDLIDDKFELLRRLRDLI